MRKLTLVAGTESTARVLSRQLEEYLEGRVAISSQWIDEPGSGGPRSLGSPLRGDPLVLSSSLVRDELIESGLLEPGSDPVVARRTVDCDGLDEVVALPPGTSALFVNDRAETAVECVEILEDLGLGDVLWRPWSPGSEPPPSDFPVAVVAGESGLVPPGIPRVIDIGTRVLDFGTLAEIFSRLGLPEDEVGRVSRRYLSKIVNLARRLARSNEEARRLSGHLGAVIDSLRHGILVYDADGRVSVCNDELRALFNIRRGERSPQTLSGLFRSRELLDFLECRCGEETGVFKLPEGSIVARRFDLGGGGHTVATFRDERDAAAEASRLAREYRSRGHVAKWGMDDIVGLSEAILRAKRIAERLAATDLTILIDGESGTGKELFASAMHAASARASGPFLAVDLGALSDDLIESELFGYEEGAFTGARKGGKAGLFELADGGTIFLDEIGNVSPKVQKRLLRVLQEKEIMRVGGSAIKRIDVRVIAATNEDLIERSTRREAGESFRSDLYFRLKMGALRIPPLRERLEDIPLLVARFLGQEGSREVAVDPEVLTALARREWPGNVRELRNLLTYMLAVREGSGIRLADLPDGGSLENERSRRGESSSKSLGFSARPSRLRAREELEEEGAALDSEERLVLEAIAELGSRGRTAGREAVAAFCRERGLALGPGAVRARYSRLAGLGLVTTCKGRGGTRLTEQGLNILHRNPS